LTSGASFPNNPNYFTLYFCGNSYYTVVTSVIANNPYLLNSNILSANSNTNYQGPTVNQISAHAAAMKYLNSITNKIITNTAIIPSVGNYSKQYINQTLAGGYGATSVVNLEFGYLTSILTATNLNAALSVVPSSAVVKTGTVPSGAGSAITLIKNNITFLTNEIVAYVNNNFASVFADDRCKRDTGLIVDALAEDILYYNVNDQAGNLSDLTFSGLQYWSQQYDTGFATQNLVAQSTATIASIKYLTTSTLSKYISDTNQKTVSKLFGIINNILVNGPIDVTDSVVYGGPINVSASLISDAISLQTNKADIQASVVKYANDNFNSVLGSTQSVIATRCYTDVGLIIDAVTFDMLNGGNVQSTKAGVYYYDYSPTYSVIPRETTATVAAFNYLASIATNLIQGNVGTTFTPLQTKVKPQTNYDLPASSYADLVNLGISTLTNIILNGPGSTISRFNLRPQNVTTNSSSVPADNIKAWQLLHNNRDFIQAEVLAYISANYSSVYNPTSMSDGQANKCARDVGLTLQQLMYDLETGGNYNMIYAGLSYWSRADTYHVVELGEAAKDPALFPDGTIVNFYQRSYISASGYVFEYVGAGTNYGALPQVGRSDPIQGRETVQLNSGKVFFTSTDQNGDFRIGPGLVISQATGVISGRTFTQSLFANMTPFILAIT
jgi:hypothetical protein